MLPALYETLTKRAMRISDCKKDRTTGNAKNFSRRILGRRYALIPTSYKYLKIGISVETTSCVELVLGDNRDIERLVQSSPLRIRDLIIEVVKISDSDIIKMTMYDNSLYIKLQNVLYLFDFEKCIDHMYYWLCENTHIVNKKFK
ncbi:hypothetical protein ACFW04_008653 [Cataglyphis niger]